MESNCACKTETDNLFHAASSLCHILSTVLAEEGWQASLSATYDQIFSMGDRFGDRIGMGSN